MKTVQRDLSHALSKLVAMLLPLLVAVGCSSGVSGHAPGLAGPQTQDPGTLNFPLAYIRRPPPTAKTDVDVRDLITSATGGDVYIREQASAGSPETNITAPITKGMGDVRDLDPSVDGKKLLFSLRLPLDPKKKNTDKTQPTWKIYQYDAVAKTVTQLTNDNTTAGHDVGAHYLPDGRIVFSSTRQAGTQAILIDKGRPQYPAQIDNRQQPIFLLHVMNGDGTNIHQISFNTNHDFAPSVMTNGQIVFSRYEAVNGDQISLYRANPDGSKLELLYGANSHKTGADIAGTNVNPIQFLNARQQASGKLIAIVRPFIGTQLGGDIVQIDAQGYVEIHQPAAPGGGSGPAQASATTLGVTTDPDLPSLGGRFYSAYPLYDGTNRMLVSWAPCLILDTTVSPAATRVCTPSNTSGANVQLAPPQYTLWIYDLDKGTLSPILGAEAGSTVIEPVILQARVPAPSFVPDVVPTGDAAKLAQNTNGALGLLVIRSVYDFDGVDTVSTATGGMIANIAALADPKQATASQRPARFLRIEKAVEIPDNKVRKINNSAFGPANMGMREILAYVPVQPDGSVRVQVPANVPFTIDILDKNARRIGARHESWLQLAAGETKTCNGCHTAGSQTTPSHGRAGLTASAYAGAASAGAPFPNTVASLSVANPGDTMADTVAVNTCRTGSGLVCADIGGIDVIYTDIWTDPVARTPDASFSYLYANLSTQTPANSHCKTWDPLCRSTIHYPLAIQPIWKFVRPSMVAGDVHPDHTCVLCHNPVNAAAAVQVPAGQLDLTGSTSNVDTTVFTSYEQLLFAHNEQTLNMGVLTDLMAPGPISLPAPMSAGSAIASQASFLSKFDGTDHGATVDHTGYLTTAELRLISEWLDIGAQYYNDPFVARRFELMRRLFALLLLLQAFVGVAHAKRPLLQLVVTQAYLEMRSGPGRGFPVVYVVGRDEVLTVLFSRTDWYKVRAPHGQEGWARRADLARTILASGEPAPIPPYPDFVTHRWELGAGYGVFNHQNLVTAYGDFGLTDSLDAEFVLQQAFGTIDNRYVATVGLRHTFIPEWKWWSPTAGIGLGYQYVDDKVPPKPLQDTNQMAYASLGMRGFITRRFMWRADWRVYKVFTNQNQNQEPQEWKFGLAVFF